MFKHDIVMKMHGIDERIGVQARYGEAVRSIRFHGRDPAMVSLIIGSEPGLKQGAMPEIDAEVAHQGQCVMAWSDP